MGPDDVALWSKSYRDGLPWAGIAFPAHALRLPGGAAALKKNGHRVDVRSSEELSLAVSAGIAPARIVMHDDGVASGPIRRAVMVGVGYFVVRSATALHVLGLCARAPQRVLVDVTGDDCRLIGRALGKPHLRLIGLHSRVELDPVASHYGAAVGDLIAQMAHTRREHGVLLHRVSVAGAGALSPCPLTRQSLVAVDLAIEDAVDDACARYRFPRPALVLTPTPADPRRKEFRRTRMDVV
jgi:diaminopimelate decarboxylase